MIETVVDRLHEEQDETTEQNSSTYLAETEGKDSEKESDASGSESVASINVNDSSESECEASVNMDEFLAEASQIHIYPYERIMLNNIAEKKLCMQSFFKKKLNRRGSLRKQRRHLLWRRRKGVK